MNYYGIDIKVPTPEEELAQTQVRGEQAQVLMEKNPRLSFITAFIIAGDQASARRSLDWMRQGLAFEHAVGLVGSYGRLGFLLDAEREGFITRDQLLDALPEYWPGSDPDDTDRRFLDLWFEAFKRNGRVAVGDPLPRRTLLTVYRGQFPEESYGIAWTLDRKVAQRFADGASLRTPTPGGVILKGRVRRSDVLAYLTERGESEVILDPRVIAWIERVK